MSQLIDFYSGHGADHRGRTLDEILSWNDERLESVHDYIQWLFPLAEASRFNPYAPLLTGADCAEFQRRTDLRANVLRSFRRMLVFYGFAIDDATSVAVDSSLDPLTLPSPRGRGVCIVPLAEIRHWISPGDHNYLRITRILTSLRLLGFEEYARAFFAALKAVYAEHADTIGETTFSYWRNAVES
jgi:hypothetical protein